jgi:hypothetical protein
MLIDVKPKRRMSRATVNSARIRGHLQALVDGQTANIGQWLKQTAEGIVKVDVDGNPVRDSQGSVVYVNKPDPGGAVKLVSELAEYVIPKLSRSEVSATVEHLPIDQQSSLALQQRVLESLGLTTYEPEDVEPIERSDG